MIRTRGEKIFQFFLIIFMIILLAIFFLPYWLIFVSSLTDEMSILKNGFQLWPKKWSFDAYKFIFGNDTIILRSVINSTLITVIGTALAVFSTAVFAYPLSKRYLPGRKVIMIYVLITMLFGGGLVPYYLVVRGLGLYNSFLALIIPGSLSTWNMILVRNFLMSLPESLEESAKVDGASDFTVFMKIMLPLSKPVLATITLFYAVGYWNDWFSSLLFISDRKLIPIQAMIREMLSNFSQLMAQSGVINSGQTSLMPQQSTKMAAIIVASLPIIMIYPFLQKYFIKGVMIGSIKG